jgi:xanthine dehydrogenase accessory factor
MLTRDEDVLSHAQSWAEEGREVAIATVVETWGSAPRPTGSHLVIDGQGNFLGSVSGGCVEGAVVAEAADVIAADAGIRRRRRDRLAGRPLLRRPDQGLCREARLMRLDVLKAMNLARRERRAGAVVTRLSDGEQRFVGAESIGADPLGEEVEAALRMGKSATVTHEGVDYFLTVQAPAARLALIGAVHISQALAPIARVAGLDVTIIDPRTAFATEDRFPDTPVIAKWPDEALAEKPLDRFTAICLLTHDPKIDDPALMIALKAECFYIGALGSRKTHGRRIERMRAQGFDEAALGRIHAPIGLDIGAVSPAEIAVSIMGEIIASMRKKPLRAERAAA